MNKNYRNGRAREYRIMNRLKEEGYEIVLRSAGSHSAIDIVGIKKDKVVFIQSKPKNFSNKKMNELLDKYDWINDKRMCEFRIVNVYNKNERRERKKNGYCKLYESIRTIPKG